MGRRHGWLSFSRFAIRPTNFGNGQRQKQRQQCRKRKIKRCRSERTNVMRMEYGDRKRRKHQQIFTLFSNTPAFQRSVALDLPQTAYLMRVLDNLRHQKPMENDEEGTSEGNTTQETFDTEEKVLQINHMQTSTKNFNYMQSSSTDPHTSKSNQHTIPSLVPPPPIAFTNLPSPDDDEALASMLMSWYMTGYHTGYYQSIMYWFDISHDQHAAMSTASKKGIAKAPLFINMLRISKAIQDKKKKALKKV
ncbi:hypothetical protein LOAG_18683 [Loa loa]|uniref:Uncharacterized protein n=1 Tax=Loa loa TaxID=7209 RepID=A0A1S0UER6_LOALO|nr:hypothetical protein LOAG_18683 [Loa loa]EJD73931.1 hypothetical protein LOAG_18683 [Loa loa]